MDDERYGFLEINGECETILAIGGLDDGLADYLRAKCAQLVIADWSAMRRELFAPAVEHAAHSLILAYNHPSGDLTPSENDVLITKQIAHTGRVMGIELVDHLIIGGGGFVSLKCKRIF